MARSPQPIVAAGVLASTLSAFRYGAPDPTTRLSPGEFWRATLTPLGSGTLHLDWRDGHLHSEAWGDGAEWLLARVPAMTGTLDPGHVFADAHPAVMRAQHLHPDLRFGASGTLYHELLPTVLGQRVTAGEALLQWRRLVDRLGELAPGPAAEVPSGLRLPPQPEQLADRPAWWFHPLGIEAKRAEPLRLIGRHALRIAEWSALPAPEAAAKLRLLRGIGEWTTGSALGVALGDPDSVAVGDFHLKNLVVHALTGRARGTDDEMLELLAPYAGQRGRVVRLLQLDGHRPPKFGPRQRVLPMNRW
jgi:3-methyladenine DNA glycosylase/8-oxoguanine DNA glycosylase